MPLTHLDLSSNEIVEVLDVFLNEVKYLNLSNNDIEARDDPTETCFPPITCSIGITHFKNLSNLEVLSLRSMDRMDFIPKSLLSQSDHPLLHTIEWTGSVVCDCNAQALQTWLLTDKRVYLKQYTNNINQARHFDEWNYCCYSYNPRPNRGFSLTAVPLDCTSSLWMYIFVGVVGSLLIFPPCVLSLRYRTFWWHGRHHE